MVLPDGTGSHPGKPQTGRVILVALAGLVVVGGFVGLSALSSTDPEAAVETTSTPPTTPRSTTSTLDVENFTVADIAQGEPLQWGLSMAIDEGHPLALVEHGGSWFLFTTEMPTWSSRTGGGLRAWRSVTGTDWEPLGQVIGPNLTVSNVVATDHGLVALGTDWSGTGFSIWRSGDGVDWIEEQVTFEAGDPPIPVLPHAYAATEAVSLVVGSTYGGVDALVYERLSQTLGEMLDIGNYGWSTDVQGEDISFSLFGPFGFPLATLTAEDVGLTTEERALIIAAYDGSTPGTQVLRSTDSSPWQQTSLPDAEWVDWVFTGPDGRFTAFGYVPTGPQMWNSTDRLVWDTRPAALQPYLLDNWGGLLVGPEDSGRPSILVSRDGTAWEDVGPGDLFPHPIEWSLGAMGSGPGGIAVQVTGWPPGSAMPEPREPVVLITEEAQKMTFDFDAGTIDLLLPDGSSYRWSMYATVPEGISANLTTGHLEFRHRETEETLAVIGLEEISAAEMDWGGQESSPSLNAFAFTSDGSTWTIQDHQQVAADSYFPSLEVTGSHVIAVRVPDEVVYAPDPIPGFEVWAAEIP